MSLLPFFLGMARDFSRFAVDLAVWCGRLSLSVSLSGSTAIWQGEGRRHQVLGATAGLGKIFFPYLGGLWMQHPRQRQLGKASPLPDACLPRRCGTHSSPILLGLRVWRGLGRRLWRCIRGGSDYFDFGVDMAFWCGRLKFLTAPCVGGTEKP